MQTIFSGQTGCKLLEGILQDYYFWRVIQSCGGTRGELKPQIKEWKWLINLGSTLKINYITQIVETITSFYVFRVSLGEMTDEITWCSIACLVLLALASLEQ